MLAINEYLNKAKEGVVGLTKNISSNLQQPNNDIAMINQAIMQKGVNGLSPEERQIFEKYYMNPVMGATNAPQASPAQVAKAKKLFQLLNKNSQEIVDPVKNTQELDILAKEVGVGLNKGTGRALKSTEEIVNDIIKARKVGATVTKDLRIPDIPQIKLQDKIKLIKEYIQKKGTGKMAGSKPTQPKGVGGGTEKWLKEKWVRGVNEYNQSKDLFASTDKGVAGEYGAVRKVRPEELPNNPLIVKGGKENFMKEVGYNEAKWESPLAESIKQPKEETYDYLIKKYATERGHDGIIYTSGTMDVPELVVFRNLPTQPKEVVPKDIDKVLNLLGRK
jgi:hypothetical protein